MDSDELTSVRYVKVLFRQIEKYDNKGNTEGINAIIFYNKKRALEEARRMDCLRRKGECLGKLHGLPILVKDSFDVEFIPTTAATQGLRLNIPSKNATVIKALVEEGAVVIAKTNLAELSLALTTPNLSFAGICKNPYNLEFTSGGSSGGSAAGVSAYFAPVAIGEDTGGSIRCPSMCCGVCGFRPTTKRYSQKGIVPIGESFDTAGPIARNVKDLQLLDSVITGDWDKQCYKKIRIGIPKAFFYEGLTPEVETLIEKTLNKFRRSCQVKLIFEDIPADFSTDATDQVVILSSEFRRNFTDYLATKIEDINNPLPPTTVEQVVAQVETPVIKGFAEGLLIPPTPEALKLVLDKQKQQQQIFAAYFRQHKLDAVFIPSSTHPALPLTVGVAEAFGIYVRNFAVAPFNELPALDIPIGLTEDDLPVGGELIGPHCHDRELLSIGVIIQEIVGFISGPPGFLC